MMLMKVVIQFRLPYNEIVGLFSERRRTPETLWYIEKNSPKDLIANLYRIPLIEIMSKETK
jgi:hypothetical protein